MYYFFFKKKVLNALKFVHSLNRVHRDIKSDNLLLTTNGDVKLADFGYAAQLTAQLNKRNSVVGTRNHFVFFLFVLF